MGEKDDYSPIKSTTIKNTTDNAQASESESSHYSSAESEVNSNNSKSGRRMSLGPRGAAYLRDRMDRFKIKTSADEIKNESQPVIPTSGAEMMSFTADQMKKFFNKCHA